MAASGEPLADVLTVALDNGAFDIFAWALLFVRCWTVPDDRRAPWRCIAAAFGAGVIVLVPVRLAPAAALVLLAAVPFTGGGVPRAMRAMRFVLLALAFETVWMTSVLAPLHVAVGSLDARATTLLLRLLGQTAVRYGNVVEHVDTGFSIAIWPGCSSLFPAAAVVLAFVVTVLYRGGPLRLAQLPWLALSLAASIVLTEIRLVLLAWDEASYHWWHTGTGASVYGLAALGLSVLAPILATPAALDPQGRRVGRLAA